MITVTGATGHLGRLVITALLDRGVPAGEIVAAARTPARAADLAERGVQVREADYSKPQTLDAAFRGTSELLLISGSEVGQRVPQHANAVAAAVAAGVSLIAYTSVLNADTSGIILAEEHKATEEIIAGSGLPHVFLRNGFYFENDTENLAPALQFGAIVGSAADGRTAAASREDFAAAAAAVLTTEGHAGKVYELGGDVPFTMAELAAEVSAQSGKEIAYHDMPAQEYTRVLVSAGLPEPYARVIADGSVGISRGELTTSSGHLRALIGRPTTPLAAAVADALKSLQS